VFLVVRKGGDLSKSQEELLNHSVQGNARMAVLTNGFTWWFYLPLLQGSADEKKFLTLEMSGQKGEEISEKLLQFLSKGSVTSGKSLRLAEEIYHTRQRAFLVKEFLPKAWEKIMKEPEKWLAEPLAEVTKNLCGYKPDMAILREFIRSKGEMKAEAPPVLKPKPLVTPVKAKPPSKARIMQGKLSPLSPSETNDTKSNHGKPCSSKYATPFCLSKRGTWMSYSPFRKEARSFSAETPMNF
jgi:hypothetical protein